MDDTKMSFNKSNKIKQEQTSVSSKNMEPGWGWVPIVFKYQVTKCVRSRPIESIFFCKPLHQPNFQQTTVQCEIHQ